MKVFADTNFLTATWLDLEVSESAAGLLGAHAKRGGQIPVTTLIRMEFVNALQRLVFETRRGNQGIRMTPETALLAMARFDQELDKGVVLRRVHPPERKLEEVCEMLCLRHAAKHGFRTYDLLHVGSALLLGCDTFWSFDRKARQLARLEGLKVNEWDG